MSPDGAVGEYYERYWRDGAWADNPYERWKSERVKTLAITAPASARVLDVGCGDGRMLSELGQLAVEPTGIDLSGEAVARAQRRGIRALRADLDGGHLPVEDGAFDLVLCLDVLEHLFDPDALRSELRRVVAPGGRVVIAVPNGLNLFNRVAFALGRHLDIMDKAHLAGTAFSEHLRFFSLPVFERFLTAGHLLPVERHFFFPLSLTDSRFRAAGWAARMITVPRLHERVPSLFALEFLFACSPC